MIKIQIQDENQTKNSNLSMTNKFKKKYQYP
jgi:hypothetical protein